MRQPGFTRRYPEIPYILLACAPVVCLVVALRNAVVPFEPLLILGSWTPDIAAFIVLALVLRDKGGVRRLIAGWGKWRVGLRWYFAAMSPLLVPVLAAAAFIALGRSPAGPAQPVGLPLLSFFALSVVTGATGEELGWRGFLLPRLQRRFSALASSLIVGVVWALWHLPLWFVPGQGWEALPYWTFSLAAISSSVLFTFVLNNTGGSLLMASIIHFSMTFGMGAAGMLGLLPSPREAWVVVSLIYATAAVVIVVIAGPARLSRSQDAGHALARTAASAS